ncbi:Uncharacterised protein [Amycolatopsis camponoti]|uniref:Uncharacterized protein n=1 Tax=Amycolatopsis camponoti TaxID=2606593 RepID=A0A6I8LWL2_9PSEU|nr:Uncharacterised protein [Amycolatopsis camponoti]
MTISRSGSLWRFTDLRAPDADSLRRAAEGIANPVDRAWVAEMMA